jgi:protein gp37
MGQHSSIEWTHHTFNPWWGCLKVSPACQHCYAEAWARRVGQKVWGPTADRRAFSDAHWRGPVEWNRKAQAAAKRERVFCASMADVFEARPELDRERARLWALIEATQQLDWLLLTKRPENIRGMTPWSTAWPRNVWLGCTVELQDYAAPRISALLEHATAVHFVSCEPLLGPLDLRAYIAPQKINWVITGGESGPKARPMSPPWARDLRDQCTAAGVGFHFKQWGDWGPARGDTLERVGKKAAGRSLDGRTWDGLPVAV